MAVEAVESELAHISVEAGIEESNPLLHANETGEMNQGVELNEPIKFGSQGTDETIKGEAINVHEANLPKDAVDDWPEPKQIHSFYFMKYRSFEDQKLKAKFDQADKEIQKLNQARSQITEKLRAKRAERAQVISQVRTLSVETRQFRSIMDEKRKEMEPLQQALGKLRNSNTSGRDRGDNRGYGICSSEEELNDIIKSLNYRMAHESIPLSEEKQILREIKQLEGTRDKVIANAAVRAKIQDSLGEKEVIQDQVKLIGGDLDGVRKEQQVVKAKLKLLDDEKEAIEKQINALQEELMLVQEKKDKAFDKINELRKQREEGNACFFQNRTLLIKARELAAKKEINALKELADIEVDKFVAVWTSMKAVRDDYERRILPSLDSRQLSKDGRMRNPGEKPLVVPEVPPPSQPEIVVKPSLKQTKEEPVSAPQTNTSAVEKAPKEKNSKQQKEAKDKVTVAESNLKESKVEETEEVFGLVEKDPPKKNEVDVAKLKEMKRDEEIAKAKQAVERKKKLAEKAAAKAAIKAQKEAEKKLKDREKKAKKKAAASGSALEPEEPSEKSKEEVAEPEIAEENDEAPVPAKNKERKASAIRSRTRSRGGPDSLPKAILKRKKSTNYWVYAAPAGLLVLLLLVVGYYYLL